MSNKMNVFDNISLFAIPEASNHLVTKAYADSSLGASGTMIKTTNPVLSLTKAGQVFYLSLMSNATVSVDVSNYTFGTNEILEFTLIIFITGASVSFQGWSWHNGVTPDLSTAGWYVIHCTSLDSGSSWLAKLEGSYSFPAEITGVRVYMSNGYVGDTLVDVSGTQTGDIVTYEVDGVTYQTYPMSAVDAGTHSVTVTVEREGYQNYVQSGTVTATARTKMLATAKPSIEGYATGTNATINITAPNDAIGAVSCEYGNQTYTGTLLNGTATLTFPVTTEGDYDVTVNIAGDNTYYPWSDVVSFGVRTSAKLTVVTTLSDATTHTGTSLRDALTNVQTGGLIVFEVEGTITLEQGGLTNTNKSFIIDGGDKITVDANQLAAVITLSGSYARTIKNIGLTNGKSSGSNGGGLKISDGNTTIQGCTISNCTGGYAGGIYFTSSATTPTLDVINCTISGCTTTANSSSAGVGGIYINGTNSTINIIGCVITNCTYAGRSSTKSGGVLIYRGVANIQNCIFKNDTPHAIYSYQGKPTTITNCTIVSCGTYGIQFYNGGSQYQTYVRNTVITGSSNPYHANISHCLLDTTDYGDVPYISSLPLFESDGYTPSVGSQVIDMGDSTLINTETDVLGNPRISGNHVDIGAIEVQTILLGGISLELTPAASNLVYNGNDIPLSSLINVVGTQANDSIYYSCVGATVVNGETTVKNAGVHNVTVRVVRNGTRYYTGTVQVTINKASCNMSITATTPNGYVGTRQTISFSRYNVPNDSGSEYAYYTIDGVELSKRLSGSNPLTSYFTPEHSGSYVVPVRLSTTNYEDATYSLTFSISKKTMTPTFHINDVEVGDDILIYGNVPNDTNTYSEGTTLSFSYGGNTYTCDITKANTITSSPQMTGKFSILIPGITTAGTHNIGVSLTGSAIYEDVITTLAVNVATPSKPQMTLVVNDMTVGPGKNITLTGTVPNDIVNGIVYCTMNGTVYHATCSEGAFSLPITSIDTMGTYTIPVTVCSDNYASTTANATVTVGN